MSNELEQQFESSWDEYLQTLVNMVAIPSISFPGYSKEPLIEHATFLLHALKKAGMQTVEILEIENEKTFVPPYIFAEYFVSQECPTILLYAHYDVQPVGDEELWDTPPFEASIRTMQGLERIYGRGTADDKAGLLVHLATIDTLLKQKEHLQVNIKVIFEGEEEVGSPNLEKFLKIHKEKLQADYMIVLDTVNLDTGIPSITTSLRGIVACEIEFHALKNTLHSGLFGGLVPDVAVAMCQTFAEIFDSKGFIKAPELLDLCKNTKDIDIQSVPFLEEEFRKQAGLLEGVERPSFARSPWTQNWYLPTISITALELAAGKKAGNVINSSAWARLCMRITPGMDAEESIQALENAIRRCCPWGIQIKFKREIPNPAWKGQTKHPIFTLAAESMEKAYKHKSYFIACGASIPFIKSLEDALGGIPILLMGIEDPYSKAHGENESMSLDDLKKACLSQLYFFENLSQKSRSTLHSIY